MLGHTLKVDTMRHNETILKSESSARRPPRCPRSAQTFYARIKRSPLRSSSGLCRGSSSALILEVWIYVGQTSYSNNLPFPKFLSIFCPHLKSWKCPQSRNHQYCGQFMYLYPYPQVVLNKWTIKARFSTRPSEQEIFCSRQRPVVGTGDCEMWGHGQDLYSYYLYTATSTSSWGTVCSPQLFCSCGNSICW